MSQYDRVDEAPTRAPFVLYVVWHPSSTVAHGIAEELRRHFASDRYHRIAGGAGVTVLLRDAGEPGSTAPPSIDWAVGEIVAVIALIDHSFAVDTRWASWLVDVVAQPDERDFNTRVFPVALEAGAMTDLEVQALRWDRWPEGGEGDSRVRRLIRELTHQFTRMLRHWLVNQQGGQGDELRRYRENIQVFLSHSKHDEHGEAVAKAIREWLNNHSALASFLDVDDMLAGVRFDTAIEDAIRHGVLVAIYTDSYSSREWCRREAILAKRHGVPMLVVDCLQERDDRAFPYLWNVPVVRMDASQQAQAGLVVSVLLDEVFKDYLWQQRTNAYVGSSRTVFTSRPPELTTAALADHATGEQWAIVHPAPPLGWEEVRLFADILPNVRVCTLNEWLVGE